MQADARSKILIMEDDPLNMKLLTYLLKDDYVVFSAVTGKEALEIIDNEDLDLAILDIMMPDIDGYQICEMIKGSERTCLIPVLVITALTHKDDRIKGIEAGADEFITKPFDNFEVQVRVKSLLEKRELQLSLVEEGQKVKKYVDSTSSIFVVLNKEQNIEMINRYSCELFGLEESELIGQNWFDIAIPDDQRDEARSTFCSFMSGDAHSRNTECDIRIKDGERRTISCLHSFMLDDSGNIENCICSGIDITEKKKADELMDRYTKELEFSTKINDLIVDIMKYHLLSPADYSSSLINELLEVEDNEFKVNMLENLKRTIESMKETIHETEEYSHMELNDDIEVENYDIATMLNDLVDYFDFELQIKGVKIVPDTTGPYAIAANEPVKDVIKNLISGSIDKSPEGTVINIDVVDSGSFWKLIFTDNASTFLADGENTDSGSVKAGLSDKLMSLSKKIVELFGGELGVEDAHEAQGSVLWITVRKATDKV